MNAYPHAALEGTVEVLTDAAAVRRYAAGDFVSRPARLDLAGPEEPVLAVWRARLERNEEACGCHEGAAAVFLVLLAGLVLSVAGAGVADPIDEPLLWLAVVFAAGAIGKFAGLAAAAVRLLRLARDIRRWEAAR